MNIFLIHQPLTVTLMYTRHRELNSMTFCVDVISLKIIASQD